MRGSLLGSWHVHSRRTDCGSTSAMEPMQDGAYGSSSPFQLQPVHLEGGAFHVTLGREGDHPGARAWQSDRQEGNGNLQVRFQHESPPRSSAQTATGFGQVHHRLPTYRSGTSARKHKVGQWTNEQMYAAITTVERGAKVRAVARNFDIPASTLADHVNGRILHRKKGPPTVFTQSEEKALEEYILKMQEYGYPLSIDQLRLKVAEIIQDRVTPFRDGILGYGWIKWFKKRHLNLAL